MQMIAVLAFATCAFPEKSAEWRVLVWASFSIFVAAFSSTA